MSYDFIVELSDSRSSTASYIIFPGKGLSLTEFSKKNLSQTRISSSETFCCPNRKGDSEYYKGIDVYLKGLMDKSKNQDNFSEREIKNEIWTSKSKRNEKKSIPEKLVNENELKKEELKINSSKEDFKVLYSGMLNKHSDVHKEEQSLNANSDKNVDCEYISTQDFLKADEISVSTFDKSPSNKSVLSQIHLFSSVEKNFPIKLLKCKSNSSPRENLTKREFPFPEHRLKRLLHIANEIEKIDFQNLNRAEITLGRGIAIRKTGSALIKKGKKFIGSIYIRERIGTEHKITHQCGSEFSLLAKAENERTSRSKSDKESIEEKINFQIKKLRNKNYLANQEDVRRLALEDNETQVNEDVTVTDSTRTFKQPKPKIGKGIKRMSLVILLSKTNKANLRF